jgi:protein phosphatase PTC1
LEDANGKQAFEPNIGKIVESAALAYFGPQALARGQQNGASSRSGSSSPVRSGTPPHDKERSSKRDKIRSLFSGNGSASSSKKTSIDEPPHVHDESAKGLPAVEPVGYTRRVLYTANVGDARAVLSRGGKAIRLTYDHKGSDKAEVKRITEAGGFVLNNRVNGVLAVTRSLGDTAMKEFVVGSPYTSEMELCDEDDFLIIACDGLWDVVDDQKAVDLVHNCQDSQQASELLLRTALENFSHDNVTVLVVKLNLNKDARKAVQTSRAPLDPGTNK